ncbi:hypothetical protein Tco_0110982 [Tanacetum coccineum]
MGAFHFSMISHRVYRCTVRYCLPSYLPEIILSGARAIVGEKDTGALGQCSSHTASFRPVHHIVDLASFCLLKGVEFWILHSSLGQLISLIQRLRSGRFDVHINVVRKSLDVLVNLSVLLANKLVHIRLSAVLAVLATRSACRPSVASCLSSHGESLPSMPNAYEYPAAVAMSDVPGDGSRVHTHDHGGSEAPDRSSDSFLSSKPKPLGKHKPPPSPFIRSPRESSYPP